MNPQRKILTLEAADEWVRRQKTAGRRIGFTCGSFDLMHAGHVQYLAEARQLCDRLLVAVNSDASVRKYKSPLRPINPWNERAYVVAALAAVDRVTVLDHLRPLPLLLRWKPDLYLKGGDYKKSSLRSAGAVEAYGGKTVVIPPAFPTSTTSMLDRIHALSIHAEPKITPAGNVRGLVMLDRDGTLVHDVPFLHEPDKVRLLPGVTQGLRHLQQAGFLLALVTNQQGMGLGYYGMREFIAVNQRLLGLLHEQGVTIWKIFFCPHSMADGCSCRKPQSGMLLRAIEESGVSAARSFLVGDTAADIQAARAAGCRAVYVGKGDCDKADFSTPEFGSAAQWVVRQLK